MKKLLTVLLTVLMAFTLVTVNVSADTYNKRWGGFSWRKLNTEAVEEVKEEEPVVEEVQEEVVEAVVAEDVEEVVGEVEPANVEWTYSLDELTFTATPDVGDPVSFTVEKPANMVYSGEGKEVVLNGLDNFLKTTGLNEDEVSVVYYKSGKKLDADALPTDAGKYVVEVSLKNNTATLKDFEITKYKVTVVDFEKVATHDVYNGESHFGLRVEGFEDGKLPKGISYYDGSIFDGFYVNKATNVGEYKGCVYLSDSSNYEWEDGSTGYKTYTWSIVKALVSYEKLVEEVKKLNEGLTYNATLQQPKLPAGVRFATLGNIPFVTKYDCIAIDQGGYDALVTLDGNHEWDKDAEGHLVTVSGLFGDQVCAPVHWSIQRAVITKVTVQNATKEYGDIDPTFDVKLEGVLTKVDEVAVRALLVRNYDDTRMERKNAPVGDYEITVRLVNQDKGYTNYKFAEGVDIVPATLTITKAPLKFYLNVTHRDYNYTPIVLTHGLKNAEKLGKDVDYKVEYCNYDPNKGLSPLTKDPGEKVVVITLNPEGTLENYEVKDAEDGVLMLHYQIGTPAPDSKVTPKVPTAREAKAVVIRTVTSIIRNLSTKRFGR